MEKKFHQDTEKAKEFIALVYKMREAQKEYFKLRKGNDYKAKKDALEYSIQLEKQVDDMMFEDSIIYASKIY
jgi:hypothetical protein